MKTSYYQITNSAGTAWVATSNKSCIVVSESFTGQVNIHEYDTQYQKQADDMAVEIDYRTFLDHMNKAQIKQLHHVIK